MRDVMTDVILRLTGADSEYLSELAFEILADLNAEGLEARHAEGTRALGDKGGEIDLTTIVISAFSTGAVTAFLNIVQGLIARDKRVAIEVSDNEKMVKFDAVNTQPEAMTEILESLHKIIRD